MLSKLGLLASIYSTLILECFTSVSSSLWQLFKGIIREVIERKAFELEM